MAEKKKLIQEGKIKKIRMNPISIKVTITAIMRR